jgi:general secretion pathway protein E
MIFSKRARPAFGSPAGSPPSLVPAAGAPASVSTGRASPSLSSLVDAAPAAAPVGAARRLFQTATTAVRVSALPQASEEAASVPAAVTCPAEEPAIASVPRPGAASGLATKSAQEVLTSLDSIPQGTYLGFAQVEGGITDRYAEGLAILKTGSRALALLVTPEFRGSHYFFDVSQRVKRNGYEFAVVLASQQLIAAVHDQNRDDAAVALDASKEEQFAWELIESAVRMKASDIHIESAGAQAKVLFRINGERVPQAPMSARTANGVCSTLYNVHADSNNKETQWDMQQVQDTVIDRVVAGMACQIRFHTAPIHPAGSFHCVMRLLLMSGQSTKSIEEIGYSPAQSRKINEALSGSNGLLVFVGAVNAGKSTSMQAAIKRLRERRGPQAKIVTVEDPVEYVIPGACQMGIPKGRANLKDSFSSSIYDTFLKATLREDTDVVMLGEIRSEESASTVKDLVLTGRKTLSTLHVYEAFAAFARLRELGIPQSLLTTNGFVAGIVFQKLLATLCQHCALTYEQAFEAGLVHEDMDRRLRILERTKPLHQVRFRCADGCAECNGTGIVSRSMCSEVLVPDARFLELMKAGDETGAKEHWLSSSELNVDGLGVTALAHATSKMLRGEVDPREVENQLGMLVFNAPAASVRQISAPSARRPMADSEQQPLTA